MSERTIPLEQARAYLLRHQGISGVYRFHGKQGVLDFIQQAGCIQFDPIDVCGKNAELVLQSRVEGFTKDMLYDLLYQDRLLVDYFDKNLSILPVADWRTFIHAIDWFNQNPRAKAEVDAVRPQILQTIREQGPICSADLDFKQKVDWYWSSTNLSRAALETLYFQGTLIIHHKRGTRKYYALAEDHIPPEHLACMDLPDPAEHFRWRIARRISAVGLLWNKPSDAWLGIEGLKAPQRAAAFHQLEESGAITHIHVETIPEPFFLLTRDLSKLDAPTTVTNQRTELIAPLDNFIWDRKLIQKLFDFDYKWEIYTKEIDRKYGYYVLPLLQGKRFIGRAECIANRKANALEVKNVWLEAERVDRDGVTECFERFARFHELGALHFNCAF